MTFGGNEATGALVVLLYPILRGFFRVFRRFHG